MRETAVPVRLGKQTVALLETGQILYEKPKKKDFIAVAAALLEEGRDADEIESLRDVYMSTKVVDEGRYRAMITLLNAFALQLGDVANRVVLEHRAAEPAVVRKAKKYIMENLDSPLRLDDVATHANVSSYYFCKVFKQATGITFTEFVNRQRVERAKKLLLDPEARVTEIAYEVGFQSLSQFNRSFLKIVGNSPTEFRRRMNGKKTLVSA
jgi:AraC-like DNA-binding protein